MAGHEGDNPQCIQPGLAEQGQYNQECQVDAGNDLEKAVYCVRAYIQGIKDDNEKIISFTKENFAKHFWTKEELPQHTIAVVVFLCFII